jgi:hypothetical protein
MCRHGLLVPCAITSTGSHGSSAVRNPTAQLFCVFSGLVCSGTFSLTYIPCLSKIVLNVFVAFRSISFVPVHSSTWYRRS